MRKISRIIRHTYDSSIQYIFSLYKRQSFFLTTNSGPPIPKSIKLSKNQYFQLDRFFLRFFNSKSIRGAIPGKSLAFVVGAQCIGKTQYIEKNLAQIKKRKKQLESSFMSIQKYPEFDMTTSPQSHQTHIQENVFENSFSLIVKKNYKKEGGQLNYRNFVEQLHDQILEQIHELMMNFENSQKISNNQRKKISNNSDRNNSNQPQVLSLLTPEIIKNIVIHQYAPQYIFMHIKDVIYAIIEQKDAIWLKKQDRQFLENWNDENLYGGICTYQYFFDELYEVLIQILWKATKDTICDPNSSLQIQKSQVAINLFYSVFMRIQYENRPSNHLSSWYQTGIQTTNFIFELLNFLSGTGKYLEKLEKAYTQAEIQSERREAKEYLEKSNNFILLGNHIDVMICLMNLEDLMCFKNKSRPFLDFFDHLVCRTVNQGNMRKHFPIMIEIPNRAFLDDILQLGKIQGSNPVIIQIPGYIQHFMKSTNLIQIFDEKWLVKIFESLGRNPHTWKNMIENMAKGVSIEDIQVGKAEYQKKQKLVAEAKLNRVYTNVRNMNYLDKETLDFEIRQTLKLFSKARGMGWTFVSFVGTMIYQKPYFISMLEENVFYHMYYLPYVDYSMNLPSWLSFYRDQYIKKLRRNNNEWTYQKWRYQQKEFYMLKIDMKYKRKTQQLCLQHDSFGKEHEDLQFSSTYYGPMKDYGVQYYHNAYKIQNVGAD